MLVTGHARAQLAERLPPEEVAAIVARLERARGERARCARVVARLGEHRGIYLGETSNGDLVVAITEDRKVITVMYRRSIQPLTRERLRVSKVLDVDGKPLPV